MSAAPEPLTGAELLNRMAARAGSMVGVHFQVADRCNHACKHCYQVQGEKGELTFEQVCGVLDDLAASGVLLLSISGGEATLRSDLVEILRYARSKGFAVRLFTNGYNVDDHLADEIAALGLLEVHISVYSNVDAEHDGITRVPGSLKRTLGAIRALTARGVRVVMKSPLLRVGPNAFERLTALAAEIGCDVRFSSEVTPAEDGSLAPKMVEASPRTLVEEGVLLRWEEPKESLETARAAKLKEGPCGVCRTSVTVLPNGEVRPCTDTIAPLGNLTESRFRDIVDGNETVHFLGRVKWSDVHGCRDCDLLPACKRCHASAAHEGGDYLGPYASGCSTARARYEGAVGPLTLLAPGAGCAPDRVPSIGPYRIENRGVLLPIPDRLTDVDRERATSHEWLRADRAYMQRMVGGAGNRTVPLRRSASGDILSGATREYCERT